MTSAEQGQPHRALNGGQSRCAAAALAATIVLLSGAVRAEGDSPAPANAGSVPGTVPPRLTSEPVVEYPQSAKGDAVVTLKLTITKNGVVESAKAIDGAEPFATAAEKVARTWRFEPATRNGQPVGARIRFELRFVEPVPPNAEDGAPDGATTSPANLGPSSAPHGQAESSPSSSVPSSPTDRPPVDEVTVTGLRRRQGAVSMSRAEIRQLPGAFGDPFRAVEVMPGVTPIASGVPFFYVRGAPPGNVGYFLDGIRVPYLYHVGLGPSVIHPGMVEGVDLYPGAYPARFGGFAGGIVTASTAAPSATLRGEGNWRLFDVGALVETGFAGGRGTALVAGRYSYTAALLSLIAKDITLDYRDFEARVTYDLTPNDRVTVFGFGAYDLVAQRKNNVDSVLFGSEFYRLDTRYDHRFGPGASVRTAVTVGLDQSRVPDQPRNVQSRLLSGRIEGTHAFSGVVTLRVGGDVMLEAYRADARPYSDPDSPDFRRLERLFPPRDDLGAGGWGELALKWQAIDVTPAVRVQLFRSGGASAAVVEPRIASRIRVSEGVHMLNGFGVAHQPPSFVVPIPGLSIGKLQGGLQKTIQSSAGLQVELGGSTTATATVFQNLFLGMSDTLGVLQAGDQDVSLEQRSLGSGVGAEVSIQRRLTRRLGGFFSYTLSRSMRTVGRERFPSSFDRTHVANAAVAYDLGRNWRAGTRLMFYTGVPSVASSDGLIAPPRSAHPPRDEVFYRVDLRFEKRWQMSRSTWLSFVAEMMNATLHKEVLLGQTIGPISIPSVGLEGGF